MLVGASLRFRKRCLHPGLAGKCPGTGPPTHGTLVQGGEPLSAPPRALSGKEPPASPGGLPSHRSPSAALPPTGKSVPDRHREAWAKLGGGGTGGGGPPLVQHLLQGVLPLRLLSKLMGMERLGASFGTPRAVFSPKTRPATED